LTPTTTPEEVRYDPLDRDLWRDPYPTYRLLRDLDPVHFVEDRGFWVLSRFNDVFNAATDTDTFSSAEGLTFADDEIAKLGLAPTLVMMDRPKHTLYRRLVNQMFTPRRVKDLESEVRSFARERVQRISEAGDADLVAELAGPLPSFVVAHYLGVPESDRSIFGDWSSAIVQANSTGRVLDAADAVRDLYRYFTELVELRRREPREDMISSLLNDDVDGRPVDVEEILGFCFVMVAGGNDTASGLLSQSAAVLTEFAGQRELLLGDPGLIPGAVEELLRFTSPVQGLSRTTTREVEIEGVTVPRGRKVHLLYAAANRDQREFGPDADELDVTRDVRRMLAFSSGPHHCLGAAAARLQGRVVLEELLARLPRFAADANAGRYAPGPFTRRFEYLPIRAVG